MTVAKAVNAVLGGLGQRAASREFGVPRSTIQDALTRRSRTPQKGKTKAAPNKTILVISDLHAPYNHPDTLPFLKAVKKKYKPDRVVSVGDELDFHAMSFHDSDADLPSAGGELKLGQAFLRELETMFPQMDLVESNHGSMAFRRAKAHGIPRHLMVSYRDAIFADHIEGEMVRTGKGEGWDWHPRLTLEMSNGEKVCFVHTAGMDCLRNAEHIGMAFVQGHHHEKAEIRYTSNPDKLYWGMTVGCSIDDDAMAFAYNKVNKNRPLIGHAIIENGFPKLLPMPLERGGKWNGYVP